MTGILPTMYNTSGSDIDIDDMEMHSGSRKVKFLSQRIDIHLNMFIFFRLLRPMWKRNDAIVSIEALTN